jgi:hypothetical protein
VKWLIGEGGRGEGSGAEMESWTIEAGQGQERNVSRIGVVAGVVGRAADGEKTMTERKKRIGVRGRPWETVGGRREVGERKS